MFAVSLQYPSSRSKLPQNSASSTLSFVITDALTFVTPPPNSSPYINETAAQELNVTPVTLEQLLKDSDLISVHCPLTKDTYHLIGKEEMTLLKPNAILVNTARGGIIDETALIEALQNGKISGAGVDVFENEPVTPEHPLLHMDNVIATPHSAWYSETAIHTLQKKVAEEVVNVLNGNPPFNCVNMK